MKFGIDIGTTSVSGVAVDELGRVATSATVSHEADLPSAAEGVAEQDPEKLFAATERVLDKLEALAGKPSAIGWTGQMHGVVGLDRNLKAVTPFVTWRDRRRFGGRIMAGWKDGIWKCVPVSGYAIARLTGRCLIDSTFLHSWYLDEFDGIEREKLDSWLPDRVEGIMLGDNQAGVLAAQRIVPGAAVINIGTSAQLSSVVDEPFAGACVPGTAAANGLRTERRPFPGGKTLICRAAIAGGRAWADLREKLGLTWDEMNASDDPEVIGCADRIVGELSGGIDLSVVSGVIGIGNGLTRNPALKAAVERRFGVVCRLPEITELAAYGAACHCGTFHRRDGDERPEAIRSPELFRQLQST